MTIGAEGCSTLQNRCEDKGEKLKEATMNPLRLWWTTMDSKPIVLKRSICVVEGENAFEDRLLCG